MYIYFDLLLFGILSHKHPRPYNQTDGELNFGVYLIDLEVAIKRQRRLRVSWVCTYMPLSRNMFFGSRCAFNNRHYMYTDRTRAMCVYNRRFRTGSAGVDDTIWQQSIRLL